MASKADAALTWKKKKWFQIISPPAYDSQFVGETLAEEASKVVGKTIVVNVMHLTRNIKKQNLNLTLKVTDVAEGKANTRAFAFEMQPGSIKRLIRGGRDRIDESFITKSKDGQYSRVKPLFITRNHQPASVCTKIRRLSTSFLRKYVAEVSFEEFVRDTVEGKVQKMLKDKLAKVTPLRNVEIRRIDLIENFNALKLKRMEKRAAKEQAEADVVIAASEAEAKAEEEEQLVGMEPQA